MRIFNKAAFDWDERRQRFVLAEHRSEEYHGPILLAKKGRESQQKVTDQELQTAQTNAQRQADAYNTGKPYATSLMATAPGELSPRALANYQSNVRNIHDTYGQNMRNGFRALAYRGFGTAPSGFASSIANTADRDAAANEVGAYVNAQNETGAEGLQGLNYFSGQQAQYDPQSAYAGASNSAFRQSQMGSTLGDIGSGLTTAAGVFSGIGTGGGKNGFGMWG